MKILIGTRKIEVQLDVEDHARFFIKGNFMSVASHGYVRCLRYLGFKNGKSKYRQSYLHRMILNAPENMEVDHINGDRLDNRRSNLRLCTRQQNAMNVSSHGNKYRGVYKNKKLGTWSSQITVNRKTHTVGNTFFTPEEAARAYNKKAKELYGKFARLNIIIK